MSDDATPAKVRLSDLLGRLPKLIGEGGACVWCGQKLLGKCTSHYDSLTCVQRPLDDEDGPTPEEWAELEANARGQGKP